MNNTIEVADIGYILEYENDVEVFDNGGTSFDRYTVIINGSVYGMSDNPGDPQGFNQYCCEVSELCLKGNEAIGKPVMLSDVPPEVFKAIYYRCMD